MQATLTENSITAAVEQRYTTLEHRICLQKNACKAKLATMERKLLHLSDVIDGTIVGVLLRLRVVVCQILSFGDCTSGWFVTKYV